MSLADDVNALKTEIRSMQRDINTMKVENAELRTTLSHLKASMDVVEANGRKSFWLIVTTLISIVSSALGIALSGKIIS